MDIFQSLCPSNKKVSCFEDIKELTVKVLEVILRFYNEKNSGCKADLILRVFGIFCCVKAKHPSAVLPEITPTTSTDYKSFFRKECQYLQWSDDLRDVPDLTFIHLYFYLVVKTEKYGHILVNNMCYKKLKAFKFFYEGYIKTVKVSNTTNFIYLNCLVKPSMKTKSYNVIIKFTKKPVEIATAICTCPAGIGKNSLGRCNHIGAILFAIEDFNRKNLKQLDVPVSCTSQLSQWNVPKTVEQDPPPIEKILIKKIKFGQDLQEQPQPKINKYDPRPLSKQNVNKNDLEELKKKLQACLPSSSFLLCHDLKSTNVKGDLQNIETEIIDTPMPTENITEKSSSVIYCSINSNNSSPFNDLYDISNKNFKNMMLIYTKNNPISTEKILQIERETRGQSSSEKWWEYRKNLLTASNFYSAAVSKFEPSNKIKNMYYSQFSTNSTKHGQENEKNALQMYINFLTKQNVCITTKNFGLIVSKTHPYLAASLDATVTNIDTNFTWGVEIKCPFKISKKHG